jgi:hypothetical protein
VCSSDLGVAQLRAAEAVEHEHAADQTAVASLDIERMV